MLKFLCQQNLVPKFRIKEIGLIGSIVCQSNWGTNGEHEKQFQLLFINYKVNGGYCF